MMTCKNKNKITKLYSYKYRNNYTIICIRIHVRIWLLYYYKQLFIQIWEQLKYVKLFIQVYL